MLETGEPRGGFGVLAPCKRSHGGVQLVAQLFRARPPRSDTFACLLPTAKAAVAYQQVGLTSSVAAHRTPINRILIFLADTNNFSLDSRTKCNIN